MITDNGYKIEGAIYTPDELFEKYEYVVRQVISKIGANPRGAFDKEDLYQEACINLLTAAAKYDDEKGRENNATFATFAFRTMQLKLMQIMRNAGRRRDRANMDTSFEDNCCGNEENGSHELAVDPGMEAVEADSDPVGRLEELISLNTSSDHIRIGTKMLVMHQNGYSVKELAEFFNVSYGNARVMMNRARMFAKEHLSGWAGSDAGESVRTASRKTRGVKMQKEKEYETVCVSDMYDQYCLYVVEQAETEAKKRRYQRRSWNAAAKGFVPMEYEQVTMFA